MNMSRGHLLPRRRPDRLRRRRATCTCRRAMTRTRSSRPATRRSTTARPATRRSTPGARPATRTTSAASCCASASARTAATRSRRATCSGRARRRPGPRSTPWASATRSASRSTGPTATSTSATTRRTPRWRIRRAAPRASAGGCSSAGRPTSAGRSASRRTSRTSTTTSRRMRRSPARSSTASGRPTTRATTPACARCRRSTQPDVWYSYNTGADLFPELFPPNADGNGIGPMGGPAMVVRRAASSRRSGGRACSTGQPLFYEWTRDYAKVFELNRPQRQPARRHPPPARRRGEPRTRTSCWTTRWTWSSARTTRSTTLEYGTGYFAELPAAQLARIDYVRGGQYTPVVRASATPASGTTAPLTVQFSSAGTTDANGDRLAYTWDFDSNGTVDSRVANPTHTYTAHGVYEATLRVTDQTGRSASWQVRVTVGNQAPRVQLTVVSTTPPFNFGDTVNFTVTITDDQPVDCARVSVAYILGHETHGHPQTSTAGCTGADLGPDRRGPRRRGEHQRRVRGDVLGQPGRRRAAAAGQRRGPPRAAGSADEPGLGRNARRAPPWRRHPGRYCSATARTRSA